MPPSDLPLVFGAFESELLAGHVISIVETNDFQLKRWPVPGLRALPQHSGPIVVEALNPHEATLASHVLAPGRDDLGPWIGVTLAKDPRRFASGPKWAGMQVRRGLSACGVLDLPGERRAFLHVLRWGWVAALEREILYRIRSGPPMHSGLRAAFRLIVGQRPAGVADDVNPVEDNCSRRTHGIFTRFAPEIGMSPDHLSLLARRSSIDLQVVDDFWRMTLAVVLRMEAGAWERAAWALGFRGGTGITELFRRRLGCTPKELESYPGLGLARIAGLLRESVKGGHARNSDRVRNHGTE